MLDGEKNLIEQAIKGKAPAFGSLYDHYQPKIYRFIFIKVSRREEAEDLTHQVFLNAWENICNYKNLGFPFQAGSIASPETKSLIIIAGEKNEMSLEEIDPESIVSHGSDEMAGALEIEDVRRAIQKLKSDYQDVIVMRFVEDLSLKETAGSLNRSEGAIKLLQHRALKELRKILSSEKK